MRQVALSATSERWAKRGAQPQQHATFQPVYPANYSQTSNSKQLQAPEAASALRVDTRLYAGADRRDRRRGSAERARRGVRAHRSRGRFWRILAGVTVLACFFVFGAQRSDLNFSHSAKVPTVVAWLPSMRTVTSAIGLDVDQVSVRGQRYTADGDIFDALNLAQGGTLVDFDVMAARKRIEALPWVRAASITRTYPGQLDINIEERSAFALWQVEQKTSLIDRSGKVLGLIDPRSAPKLPVFVGEGAETEAVALMAMVSHYPQLSARLAHAEYVGGRRWTLHLHDNVRILLPGNRGAMALRSFMAAGRSGVSKLQNQIVDLRAAGRVSVRPARELTISELARGDG